MAEREFFKIVDVYKEVEKEIENENGEKENVVEDVLVKKNTKVRWTCKNLEDITDYEEFYNIETGKKSKFTIIHHKYAGRLVIDMTYNKLNELLNKEKTVVYGFNSKR